MSEMIRCKLTFSGHTQLWYMTEKVRCKLHFGRNSQMQIEPLRSHPILVLDRKGQVQVVLFRSHPVLLQGETSVGKTSLITWLARSSGNHCVRVNNHEHTDLQEYVGCYAADESGKLVFKEGEGTYCWGNMRELAARVV